MITIDKIDEFWAEVRFPFNQGLVSTIKQLPMRKWDAEGKCWIIPTTSIETLCTLFMATMRGSAEPYPIMIGGIPWEPLKNRRQEDFWSNKNTTGGGGGSSPSGGNPFAALFAALPADLRSKAYVALAKVVHPDAGGNTQLMQQLNAAKP